MNEQEKQNDPDTRASLSHLQLIFLVLLGALGSTYVVPSLKEFRPWSPDEGIPIFRLFAHHEEVPDLAGESGAYRAPLVENRPIATPAPAPVGTQQPDISEPTSAPSAAQDFPDDDLQDGEIPISVAQPIEDPSGRGLQVFLGGLAQVAQEKNQAASSGRIVRVAHYGDSSIATDLITHTVRRLLQKEFGDAGHGFILGSGGYLHYYHRDVYHASSDDWRLREVVRKQDAAGFYGYGGVQSRAQGGAWARFSTTNKGPVGHEINQFRVMYQAHPRGAVISVWLDREAYADFSTSAERVSDEVYTVDLPRGPHRLDLYVRGAGEARLYGVIMETSGPGVVYDSLGLVGARGSRLLNFDRAHIQAQLAQRELDLLILGFGGNEADDDATEDLYYQDYTAILDHVLASDRRFGCLVLAPLDQAKRVGRKIQSLPSVSRVIAAQRRAAFEHGCAYFDTRAAMGGEGAMNRWYTHHPRLALGDFHHATPVGYAIIGNLLADALLAAYEKYQR